MEACIATSLDLKADCCASRTVECRNVIAIPWADDSDTVICRHAGCVVKGRAFAGRAAQLREVKAAIAAYGEG